MRKITLSLLLLLLPLTVTQATAEIEVLFSGEVKIREAFLKEIEDLSESLDLALYEITSPDLAQALVKAKERGIKIRVVTDSKQARIKSSRVSALIKQGISVKTVGGKEKGAMNHRFAILDRKKVMTGSPGWAEGPGEGNYENTLIIQDVDLVDSYQREFDRLWREKRVVK
jgi:phosphatidylserine/phosphatidylglycerophosphate/cardiolipin synthase-like enzyme